jgi:hypothetical protein
LNGLKLMIDWRGVEIKEGSTILYGVKGSTRVYFTEAVVESIEGKKIHANVIRRSGYAQKEKVTLSNKNVTVVSLPDSPQKTLAELNHDAAERQRLLEEEQYGCNHDWTELKVSWGYRYRRCDKCRKFEYAYE